MHLSHEPGYRMRRVDLADRLALTLRRDAAARRAHGCRQRREGIMRCRCAGVLRRAHRERDRAARGGRPHQRSHVPGADRQSSNARRARAAVNAARAPADRGRGRRASASPSRDRAEVARARGHRIAVSGNSAPPSKRSRRSRREIEIDTAVEEHIGHDAAHRRSLHEPVAGEAQAAKTPSATGPRRSDARPASCHRGRPRARHGNACCPRVSVGDPPQPVPDERVVDGGIVAPTRDGLGHREHERIAATPEMKARFGLDRQREACG